MKKLLLVGLLAFACSLPGRADLKVALIDTGKAFDAFYKTKDLATRIAAKKVTFEKEIEDLQAQYETASQEAQALDTEAKDVTEPPDLRKSSDAALAKKVEDLQSMEHEIKQMRKARSDELRDELVRSHQEISDEIMRIITAYVAGQGYDLVLDKSPTSSTSPSLFSFSSAKVVDLTSEIIARLNASH